jgi:hypothetical protein
MSRLHLSGAGPAAAPGHWTSTRLLPFVTVLVPLSILVLVGWIAWQTAWRETESEMRRAAESAAEYTQRTFEGYNVSVSRINDRLTGLSDPAILANQRALHLDLKEILNDQLQTEVAFVLDRNGYALLSSDVFPVIHTVTLEDRDYFQAFRTPDPPELFVSETFISRFDDRLLFSLSRARTETGNLPGEGGFDGVVVVSVRPAVLAEGLRRLLPLPTDKMALVRSDGAGLTTTSATLDTPAPLPAVPEGSPFYEVSQAGEKSAIYVSTDLVRNQSALIAIHKVEGFPIYAASVRSRSMIVAAWWSSMTLLLTPRCASTTS